MRPGRRSLPGCAGSPGTTSGGAPSATGRCSRSATATRTRASKRLPTVDADALGDLTRAESIEALREAVLTLPVRYREAVVLCDLQEMSYADAASALGCAVGTVRSRLHRGRALLAVKLTASERVESGEPVRGDTQEDSPGDTRG